MKAAIYARYSSENQSEKSIEDQVRVCKNYAKENGLIIDEKHIYVDEALSGSLANRPGLQALEGAGEHNEFKAVIVDERQVFFLSALTHGFCWPNQVVAS